jgi:hypothetical protein
MEGAKREFIRPPELADHELLHNLMRYLKRMVRTYLEEINSVH